MAAAKLGEWWTTGGDILHFSPRAAEIYGLGSRLTATRAEVTVMIHPEDRVHTLELVQHAVDTRSDFDVVYRVRRPSDGRTVWIHGRGKASYDDEGNNVGLLGIIADITPRKTADEAEKLRARETEHRAKNVFMLIHALVRLTPFHDYKQFVAALTDRIGAIERANAVALRSAGEGVILSDLVRRELAPYRVRGRAVLEGGPTRLTSIAAQALSMVLHELATNAAKYGSLSRPGGRLFVSWSLTDDGDLRLVWKEAAEDSGGERRGPGREEGFGSMLLRRLIDDLGGSFERRWDEAGMTATIVLGAVHVAPPRRRRGVAPERVAEKTRSAGAGRRSERAAARTASGKEAWR